MVSGIRVVTLIPIRNMSRAIKFYTKTVGGKLVMRGTGQMRNFWARLRLGQDEVWLIAPQKREKRTLSYTTFVVKNIKGFVGGLLRKGVKFQRAERMGPKSKIAGPIATDPMGSSAFFKDSEGNLMMVWQNGPGM
jgi:predicted enzyme related to lactoylglutathione lyase